MIPAYLARNEFDITPDDVATFEAFGVYTRNACVVKYQLKGGYVGTRALAAGDTIPAVVTKIYASGSSGTLTGLTGYKF